MDRYDMAEIGALAELVVLVEQEAEITFGIEDFDWQDQAAHPDDSYEFLWADLRVVEAEIARVNAELATIRYFISERDFDMNLDVHHQQLAGIAADDIVWVRS